MTKKHFILISSIIKQNKIYFSNDVKYYLFCRAFGIMLQDNYEKFDDIKFLTACGIEDRNELSSEWRAKKDEWAKKFNS